MNKATNPIADQQTDTAKRAERVRLLRGMTGMTRQKFADNFNIHYETLKGWEIARHGGLSKKGARTLVDAANQAHILTTYDWLMDGTGPMPQYVDTKQSKNINDTINTELEFFKNLYEDGISYEVADDTMQPQYQQGDYVIAIKIRDPNNYAKALGKDCIIQLDGGQLLLRTLHRIEANKCSFRCLNVDADCKQPWIYDAEPTLLAPILWHRRKSYLS